jgi:hypothetical protein
MWYLVARDSESGPWSPIPGPLAGKFVGEPCNTLKYATKQTVRSNSEACGNTGIASCLERASARFILCIKPIDLGLNNPHAEGEKMSLPTELRGTTRANPARHG